MARGISQEMLDELAAEQMFPFYAFEFSDGSTDYKYTTLDVPINLTDTGTGVSGTYIPIGFEFESINYTLSNVMDDCTLSIDNLDDVLTSAFVGGDIRGNEASVYAGLITTSGTINTVLGTLLMFTGEIDSYDFDDSDIRLVIGSIFTRWGHESYSGHPSSCRYKVFTGTRCTYSGTEIHCDRSYTRCVALDDNTANFGGFRWLPSIENKKFQWGPNQTEAEYIARH